MRWVEKSIYGLMYRTYTFSIGQYAGKTKGPTNDMEDLSHRQNLNSS